MTSRAWLPHPPKTIRPPACPTRQPRYTTRDHALAALLPTITHTHHHTPAACDHCNGWHNTETPREYQ